MEQYEYDITMHYDDSVFTEKEELNKMGRRGWILCDTRRSSVKAIPIIDKHAKDGTIYYWRRKLSNE